MKYIILFFLLFYNCCIYGQIQISKIDAIRQIKNLQEYNGMFSDNNGSNWATTSFGLGGNTVITGNSSLIDFDNVTTFNVDATTQVLLSGNTKVVIDAGSAKLDVETTGITLDGDFSSTSPFIRITPTELVLFDGASNTAGQVLKTTGTLGEAEWADIQTLTADKGTRIVGSEINWYLPNLALTPVQTKGSDWFGFANSTDSIHYRITADDLRAFILAGQGMQRFETIEVFGHSENLANSISEDFFYVTIEEINYDIVSWRPVILSGSGTADIEVLKNGIALGTMSTAGMGAGQGGGVVSENLSNNDVFTVRVSNVTGTLTGLQVKLQLQ